MHSEITLDILDGLTQTLGQQFRLFKEHTCAAFDTKELERESSKRYRKQTKDGTSRSSTRQPIKYSLNTYKHHCLGDYVESIRMYGTTDSYSTEPVSFHLGPSF